MWADEYQKKVSGRENREDTTQKISLNDSSSVNSFFSGQVSTFEIPFSILAREIENVMLDGGNRTRSIF